MLFGTPKPTVTPEDKEWIEQAFLWFEHEYSRDYLKSVRTILPTREFFPITFTGTEENAEQIVQHIVGYMGIGEAEINLHYFTDRSLELAEGIVTQSEAGLDQESKNTLGTFTQDGHQKYSIGIERELLKNPTSLIATLAHELSHLVLLGEGRISENDEELTDLNCIAMGFGVVICNSIFTFNQWQGPLRQGWRTNRSGYIPEEVATYALALLINYQNQTDPDWKKLLNPSPRKMFERNIKYLTTTPDVIKFR